mmetsp:Transcript_49995/g.119359  ORF Transcript_49995/g.119359 Transcript_49995/m.119359 type:complete len:233 (-) Transcript_49995:1626-2324(-)
MDTPAGKRSPAHVDIARRPLAKRLGHHRTKTTRVLLHRSAFAPAPLWRAGHSWSKRRAVGEPLVEDTTPHLGVRSRHPAPPAWRPRSRPSGASPSATEPPPLAPACPSPSHPAARAAVAPLESPFSSARDDRTVSMLPHTVSCRPEPSESRDPLCVPSGQLAHPRLRGFCAHRAGGLPASVRCEEAPGTRGRSFSLSRRLRIASRLSRATSPWKRVSRTSPWPSRRGPSRLE